MAQSSEPKLRVSEGAEKAKITTVGDGIGPNIPSDIRDSDMIQKGDHVYVEPDPDPQQLDDHDVIALIVIS